MGETHIVYAVTLHTSLSHEPCNRYPNPARSVCSSAYGQKHRQDQRCVISPVLSHLRVLSRYSRATRPPREPSVLLPLGFCSSVIVWMTLLPPDVYHFEGLAVLPVLDCLCYQSYHFCQRCLCYHHLLERCLCYHHLLRRTRG